MTQPQAPDEQVETEDGTVLAVRDAVERSRFEARQDGELAGFLDYAVTGPAVVFVHTETVPPFGGHGVAGALTRWALLRVRAERGAGSLVPQCPFTRRYLREHPEFRDLAVR